MIDEKEIQHFENESLKKYCTFFIGGNANHLFIVNNSNQLLKVCKYCKTHNIRYKVIGLGANLLFDDLGYDGAIIVNKSTNFSILNNKVFAESGVNLTFLIQQLCKQNLAGFEHLVGIPATIGGAVVNNVGAFDCELGNFIEVVECFDKTNFKKVILTKDECKFSYRNSIFKNENYIITSATLKCTQKPSNLIQKTIKEIIAKKSSTQPLDYPSAGSVFKRLSIIPAKVIDELGLKGTQIGNAQISPKHAGFIINLGNATSKDVKSLIGLIEEKVATSYEVELEKEIEFVN